MPKVLLDTAAYVDLQRAKRHLRQRWAINTIKHAADHTSTHGKPCLSPLGIMEITDGFEIDLMDARVKAFLEHILPMFEIAPFDVPTACLAGRNLRKA